MKKKRGKGKQTIQVTINLTNRWLYTLIAIGILAILGVGVYAATYTASGAGHPYTEISTCGNGQILKMSGGAWACGTDVDTDTTIPDTTIPDTRCDTSGTCDTLWMNGNNLNQNNNGDIDYAEHANIATYSSIAPVKCYWAIINAGQTGTASCSSVYKCMFVAMSLSSTTTGWSAPDSLNVARYWNLGGCEYAQTYDSDFAFCCYDS